MKLLIKLLFLGFVLFLGMMYWVLSPVVDILWTATKLWPKAAKYAILCGVIAWSVMVVKPYVNCSVASFIVTVMIIALMIGGIQLSCYVTYNDRLASHIRELENRSR